MIIIIIILLLLLMIIIMIIIIIIIIIIIMSLCARTGRWFWTVDPRTRQATPPRSVTDVLGVPAPVDTVFTRCNCEAKTYVIKVLTR